MALLAASAFRWLSSPDAPSVYETPLGNRRHFCGCCASPLWNRQSVAELSAVVVSSLAEESQPRPWAHVNLESKATWLAIADDLPQFASWPSAEQRLELMRGHPGAWCPPGFVTAAR